MKRILLFLFFLTIIGGPVFSDGHDFMHYPQAIEKNNFLFGFSVGWAVASSEEAKISILPIFLNAEYCLPFIPVSIDCLLGLYYYRWKYSDEQAPWSESLNYITLGTNANWHWNIDIAWLDLYTGAFIGYTVFLLKSDLNPYIEHSELAQKIFDYGAHAGAHFYFANNYGAMIELGYPFIFRAGLTFKY
jgi:hypothetical protein